MSGATAHPPTEPRPMHRHALLIATLLAGCQPTYERDPLPDWIDLTALPCALNIDGAVSCWHDEDNALEADLQVYREATDAVVIQSETPGVLRGLDADGQPLMLHCTLYGDFNCSLPEGPLRQITDWGGLAPDGEVIRRPPFQDVPPPTRRFQLAAEHRFAFLDGRDTLHVRVPAPEEADDPPGEVDEDPGYAWVLQPVPSGRVGLELAAHVDHDGHAVCVRFDDDTITCHGDGAWADVRFDDPPYRALAGSHGAFCAVDARDRIHCSDGSTHDFGPVRVLAASRYPAYDEDGAFVPADVAGVSVCAITTDNAIRCAGARYTDAMLDRMDRELGQ